MKRIVPLALVLCFAAAAWAQQSLGEIARKNRSQKKATSTVRLDDDNMPRKVIPDEPSDDTSKSADKPTGTADTARKDSADAAKQKNDELQQKLKDQKEEIGKLQRELDVIQREQRLRAAAFYADAGTQLRDQTRFADDSRKEQEELDKKKQALDAAQQKLSDLQEQARKSGMKPADNE